MRPENESLTLLGVTRARAKMYEYDVPESAFIKIVRHPEELLLITIAILGDFNNRSQQTDFEPQEEKQNMLFSAQFFDAFLNSRLNHNIGNYLLILGSAAYYLCDLPGSSKVLIGQVEPKFPDIEADGLEYLLVGLLCDSFDDLPTLPETFSAAINDLVQAFLGFKANGTGADGCRGQIQKLKRLIYQSGTDRQLLLIDTISSVMEKRIRNSSWTLLPAFTTTDLEAWRNVINKPDFIKEFWPAQILLGEQEVYKGKSAVIQMPTSAGKTRSIELILRSNFITTGSGLAVIVAPFKALCNEIKHTLQTAFAGELIRVDAPSDAFQLDFDFAEESEQDQAQVILILTPEKFLYMIRQSPEMADDIGLLVYDEGHQFDNGSRGVTYELLLSSLRLAVSPQTQIILISAVIQNAEAIGNWLMGQNKEIVDGVNLLPTYRTVGFVSWNDTLGRIEFVRPDDPDTDDFFVPRVLQISTLNSKKGEQAARRFPDKTDGKSIAVYLGLKLVKNGALAIFCGKKTTVNTIAEQISDLIDRQFQESWPLDFSSAEEVSKLLLLHTEHFGKDHALTKVAAVGIFAHSGFTPQGLRLAIEYAMQQGYIRFLICTSTLAQGVNLPIKYLMVTSFYQAKDRIKTRDFHNLIGRAGRSGIHTEGSVLFTDPQIYDKKAYHQDRYNWNLAKGLLDPSRSEPCTSMILTIFDPVRSVDGSLARRMDAVELTRAYTRGDEAVTNFIAEIYNRRRSTRFPLAFVADQIAYKLTIFSAIESYLLAHWESGRMDNTRESIAQLTEATLAFALADEDQQEQLVSLFQVLADHVNTAVPSTVKKARFGKTLLGINQLLEIEVWVEDNKEQLATINDPEELLAVIWSLLETQLKHNNLNKLSPAALHYPLALDWLRGASYQALHSSLVKQNAFIRANTQRRKITIEIVVDIVDGAFGYDSTLILGAIAEILRLENNELYEEVLPLLDLLQKRLKYGLDSRLAIAFYEAGFADRIIAAELANRFSTFPVQRMVLLREIKNNRALVRAAIGQYPSYFEYVLDQL